MCQWFQYDADTYTSGCQAQIKSSRFRTSVCQLTIRPSPCEHADRMNIKSNGRHFYARICLILTTLQLNTMTVTTPLQLYSQTCSNRTLRGPNKYVCLEEGVRLVEVPQNPHGTKFSAPKKPKLIRFLIIVIFNKIYLFKLSIITDELSQSF